MGWWWCGPACLVCVWWCWGQGGELWWSFFSPLLPAPRSLSPHPPAHSLGGANTAPVTAAVISCTVCTHWCSCFTSPLASIKPPLSRLTCFFVFCWAPPSLIHLPFRSMQHFHIVHLKSCCIFFSAPLFKLLFHALPLCPPCISFHPCLFTFFQLHMTACFTWLNFLCCDLLLKSTCKAPLLLPNPNLSSCT